MSEQPITDPDLASAYVVAGEVQHVHYERCFPCQTDGHFDPPQAHRWADEEDIEHARKTGQPEPTGRCGCWCAEEMP